MSPTEPTGSAARQASNFISFLPPLARIPPKGESLPGQIRDKTKALDAADTDPPPAGSLGKRDCSGRSSGTQQKAERSGGQSMRSGKDRKSFSCSEGDLGPDLERKLTGLEEMVGFGVPRACLLRSHFPAVPVWCAQRRLCASKGLLWRDDIRQKYRNMICI